MVSVDRRQTHGRYFVYGILLCTYLSRAPNKMARLGDESGDFVKELKKQAKSVQHEGKDKQAAKEYVDADGTVFEWDEERHGWFPKVNSMIANFTSHAKSILF